jgi:hypothetical protein
MLHSYFYQGRRRGPEPARPSRAGASHSWALYLRLVPNRRPEERPKLHEPRLGFHAFRGLSCVPVGIFPRPLATPFISSRPFYTRLVNHFAGYFSDAC